ncbi:MAG: hypothetical protein AAF985_15900 [Bacteroidota bacterium]
MKQGLGLYLCDHTKENPKKETFSDNYLSLDKLDVELVANPHYRQRIFPPNDYDFDRDIVYFSVRYVKDITS